MRTNATSLFDGLDFRFWVGSGLAGFGRQIVTSCTSFRPPTDFDQLHCSSTDVVVDCQFRRLLPLPSLSGCLIGLDASNGAMRSEVEMVTYALETEQELLPVMPELLQDIWALGSDVDAIVQAVSDLKRPGTFSVVDLGCGKGAVSIALASALDCCVIGIELFEPFVQECQQRAEQFGVGQRCKFRRGNVAELAGAIEPADVAVFAALGDVLGSPAETMRIIRKYVKPGGFILISDGFLRNADVQTFLGFEGAATRDIALKGWTSCGDELVSEIIEADDEDGNDEAELIRQRAEQVALSHPDLSEQLRRYAQNQSDEYDFLQRDFVSATWVFRRL